MKRGIALGAGHVGPADQAAEAAIAGRVAGQQDEMRAALPLPDAAQILLHGVAVAGQAGSFRTWPGGLALPGLAAGTGGGAPERLAARSPVTDQRHPVELPVRGFRSTAPPGSSQRLPEHRPSGGTHDRSAAAPVRSAARHYEATWVRDDRVDQVDLDADDRTEAGLVGHAGESDRAVEAAVVRQGERAEAEFDGSLDQLVGRGRSVEKREVAMAVQLGIGLGHDDGLWHRGESGGGLGS